MTQTKPTLSAETGGTEITRFNALRHGMLSRYTVFDSLPFENPLRRMPLLRRRRLVHF